LTSNQIPAGHHMSCRQVDGILPNGGHSPGVICRVVPDSSD
jgi:hypothetical protein